MNGFLVKPVEAALLYETLTRLINVVSARAPLPQPAVPPSPAPVPEGLLNLQRLESYRRLGMLDELLNDYLPEMARLVGTLQECVAHTDVEGSIAALHSLLGMSGEAGAQALYQAVRRVYVPMVESQTWPPQGGWSGQIAALAAETEKALKAYATSASIPQDNS